MSNPAGHNGSRRGLPVLLTQALAEPDPVDGWEPPQRPRTRGECQGGPRPCPWVSCRHHLYLEVFAGGTIRVNNPAVLPWEMTHSCSLDLAVEDGMGHQQIGDAMGITKQRAQQVEAVALLALKSGHRRDPAYERRKRCRAKWEADRRARETPEQRAQTRERKRMYQAQYRAQYGKEAAE